MSTQYANLKKLTEAVANLENVRLVLDLYDMTENRNQQALNDAWGELNRLKTLAATKTDENR